MSPEHADADRWGELEPLLGELLALPAAAREAALRERCGADEELRRRLGELLAAAQQAPSDFLLSPPLPGAGAIRLAPGDRVGPYRIEGRLGEGGMGIVFLAQRLDAPYQRPVALKVLAWPGAAAQRDRFRRESQILAGLEHPLIARLYDAGTSAEGLPYIAMERVEGLPIDHHCQRHRLSIEQRLQLFCEVCTAVQYLHRNLLVHRDLKPSNIVVTSEGIPKLLDFGIAKLLPAAESGGTPLTGLGMRPMTTRYASPEQVAGERITTASDVYSLGVLLYELLTGTSPYRSSSDEELVGEVRSGRPPAPSRRVREPTPPGPSSPAERRRLARRLAGDLDAIVDRALCKELAGRYATVGELARDVRRHLEGRPVAARRATLFYRGGKLLRRQAPLLGAALLAVLLLGGWLASLAVQRQRLAVERDLAERTLTLLLDGLRSYDPALGAGGKASAIELLSATEARVRRDLAAAPVARARLLDTIGVVYLGLGGHEAALPALREALALRREHGSAAELAESWQHWGDLQQRRGFDREAEVALRTALALRRKLFGPHHPAVAESLHGLAELKLGAGRVPEAEPLFRRALALRRRHLGTAHRDTAASLGGLANLLYLQNRFAEAERLSREALAARIQVHGERHPEVAAALNLLGLALERRARFDEAERIMRRALELRRSALGEDHPRTGQSRNNLALVLIARGAYGEAEARLREIQLGPGPTVARGRVPILVNLATVLLETGRVQEAEVQVREAAEVAREGLQEGHPLRVVVEITEGAVRGRTDPSRGAQLLESAVARARAQWDPRDPYIADALFELGRVKRRQGDGAAAAKHLREALAVLATTLPAEHLNAARIRRELAATLLAAGDLDGAAALLAECREALAAGAAAESPEWAEVRRLDELVERRRRARAGA